MRSWLNRLSRACVCKHEQTTTTYSSRLDLLRSSSQMDNEQPLALEMFFMPFSRRHAFDTSIFTDDGSAYVLDISVGTPGHLQTVKLDTGSSDLFVTDSTTPSFQNNTCAGCTFNASKSSTFQVVAPAAFNVTFQNGSTDLISDVVQIWDLVTRTVTL